MQSITCTIGSPEWLEMRKKYITATDAASIMGCSPWRSALELWKLKVGLTEEPPQSERMRRGLYLEEDARKKFEQETGILTFPKIFISEENPWAMASLDGITMDGDAILEIKCPSQRIHEMAEKGKLPPYYYAQVQHQLMVTNLPMAYYYSYNGLDGALVKVLRDETYIAELLEKEREFYQFLVEKVEPPLSEEDHAEIEISSDEAKIVNDWMEITESIKEMNSEEKRLRSEICNFGDDGNAIFSRDGEPLLRVTRCKRDGNVDWVTFCKDRGITEDDLSKYRKASIGYYKVTKISSINKKEETSNV